MSLTWEHSDCNELSCIKFCWSMQIIIPLLLYRWYWSISIQTSLKVQFLFLNKLQQILLIYVCTSRTQLRREHQVLNSVRKIFFFAKLFWGYSVPAPWFCSYQCYGTLICLQTGRRHPEMEDRQQCLHRCCDWQLVATTRLAQSVEFNVSCPIIAFQAGVNHSNPLVHI
jgi:hypothetical protein